MSLSWETIQENAITFSKQWETGAKEKQQAQSFVRAFLNVFGVDAAIIDNGFEAPVQIGGQGHSKYIDFLWEGRIAIEMKSKGENLNAAFLQLQRYMNNLPNQDDVPDLWLVCDFEVMWLDRRSTNEKWKFKTKELRKHVRKFADIAGYRTERIIDNQKEVNVKAAEKMAKLHDALKLHGYDGHDLEVYLVRLLFCLFADDTNIFPQDSFHQYIENSRADGSDLSNRIANLFEVLNMSDETRSRRTLLSDELKQFRYINGGLMNDRLPPADFDTNMRQTLLDCCNFDWNKISPAIFGAMFQGVMDKGQRRELGAHYTSEENILKLINPLFMDGLWKEFDRVKTDPTALEHFHRKLAQQKFLDPACGCGNFLIITYRELRLLELEILKMKHSSLAFAQGSLLENPLENEILVNVNQFYGIEYEDFPCQIATVGMWLIDHQMNLRFADEFGIPFVRLPLRDSSTIVHGNALRMNWENVVPKHELSYILGNPPFNGARWMTKEQKDDMSSVFAGIPGIGDIDYVTAWYYKAAEYIVNTRIHAAFVSTNSIVQGQQPAIFFKPIFERYNVRIIFAYRTFRWKNEAKGNAAVHVVIVGFAAYNNNDVSKLLIDEDGRVSTVININPYLINAPTVFIENRSKPLCDVPEIGIGNKPIDGGFYLFTDEEKEAFIRTEPQSERWFRPWYGADEFINGWRRWCLWLGDCSPAELRQMPEASRRVEAVRNYRLESKSEPTRKIADTPRRFHVENMPSSNYIVIPQVSSIRRKYIPIGFLTPDVICSDKLRLVPDATLYHFGILTSNVHMAWTRVVAGRLKSDYSYSNKTTYNNFPWPEATDEQKAEIETLAQEVLNARELFPDSSLADLYDPNYMPPELLRAHQRLDKAVWKLYGFTPQNTPSEAACVAKLMEMYKTMVEQ